MEAQTPFRALAARDLRRWERPPRCQRTFREQRGAMADVLEVLSLRYARSVNGFIMSALYSFVRARQLEGTFPGGPQTGVWPITGMRICYGWGYVPESAWPEAALTGWPPSPEPPGLDGLAKTSRTGPYQRVRTMQECRSVLAWKGPIVASFDMTDKWFDAPGGYISLPSPSDTSAGSRLYRHVECS
jgi:hypothetical protein